MGMNKMEMQMPKKTKRPLFLKIPAAEAFIPLAAAFVGQGAKALGLDAEAAEELALAAEEVVAYIARIAESGQEVEIRCFAESHFIEADISLPVRNLQLRAFNMTATVCAEDEVCLDQMGLLIASRMTDRFRISREASGNLVLTLVKEISYPQIDAAAPKEETRALSRFGLQTPDAARIKWFVRLVNQCYPATQFPKEFRYPGKVVDMAAAGDYHLLLADGPAGEIGGGLAWKWEGLKTVEIFGPYIFHPESNPDMARDLLEACIAGVARSSVLVLINRMPTPELPQGYLEALAAGADASSAPPSACFRLKHEDMGTVVWAHPDLTGFLQSEYRRLVFPRDIQAVASDGEAGEAFSVLSAEMDRDSSRATLRPIWLGADCEENLAGHVALLRREAFASIFFEMDLGIARQAEFTPGLFNLGFVPRMILPYAGVADLVIFELKADLP
jgi:anti-sigma regulatory factor (Ser/Thr protein kinase)